MRTCLGIFCGIIFLIASSFFLLVLNLNQTVYNAKFDKQALNSSGIYQAVPKVLTEMISSGKITTAEDQELPVAAKEVLINTVQSVMTPEILKKHTESIIGQTFSDKILVTEDLSDINNAINSKMGSTFSEMFGVSVTADPSNTLLPNSFTFDKSQNKFGQSVIYYKKVLWISLVVSILFLILLFFASVDNYKSRFKWVGGFLIAAAVFAIINFVVFRLVGFDWLINAISSNESENWINSVSSQLMQLVNLIKAKFSLLYLYEFGSLTILTIIMFVISAVIPAKQFVQSPTIPTNSSAIRPKETNDAPKNS